MDLTVTALYILWECMCEDTCSRCSSLSLELLILFSLWKVRREISPCCIGPSAVQSNRYEDVLCTIQFFWGWKICCVESTSRDGALLHGRESRWHGVGERTGICRTSTILLCGPDPRPQRLGTNTDERAVSAPSIIFTCKAD